MHPDAANIPLAMLAVFGSTKLLAELFEHIREPAIVGEILAGVLIGPSVLGWIAPNPVLSALVDLGVLLLLLRVGGVATLVALLGVVAPFFLGWGILALWRAPQTEPIFVGAGMVATSMGITAQVLAPPLLSLSFRAAQRAQDRLTCYARLPRARRLPV
jgi:Kef-type K+ transport system membrane component KefB